MKKKMRPMVLVRNHPVPKSVPIHVAGQGFSTHGRKFHPPRKRRVNIAEPITI
jgi:hypothetical protein